MNIVFTKHAEAMLVKRRITKDEAQITIKSPEKLTKEHSKYYASKNIGRGIIEVVFERETLYKGYLAVLVVGKNGNNI